MQRLVLLFIKAYRYGISPMMASHCRYYPTCSCYAETAVERYGFTKGVFMATKRLLRCHPWHPGGYDPVPDKTDKN